MGVPLTYTRPKHVDAQSLSSVAESKTGDSVHSDTSGYSASGIPDSLAFDSIVNGGTCPVSHINAIAENSVY